MSDQKTFPGFDNATSSPESGDGVTPSDSQDGPTIGPCGPDRVLASLSVRQALEKGLMTKDTYGPRSGGLSTSADLQSSLANRLRVRTAGSGSPEYALTWKYWDMESGPPICALRASGRRTSGNVFGGWATPTAQEPGGTPEQHLERKRKAIANGSKMGAAVTHLSLQAQIAGWPTPNATDSTGAGTEGRQGGMNLQTAAAGWPTPDYCSGSGGRVSSDPVARVRPSGTKKALTINEAAQMAGWVTPSSRDWKDTPGMSQTGTNPDGSIRKRIDQLPRQATIAGMVSTSPAPTEKRGALNPALSRWLMGYPIFWHNCYVLSVTQLKE